MKKVNNKEHSSLHKSPSLTGRLGSSEKPLNVASAPQRGANSPFATEGRGAGEGPTIICHDIVALEAALKKGVVHMVYLKKNGAMRDAHGTRATALIPEGYRAQGRRKPSPLTFAYWDTDRGGWRCLLRNRLMGFIDGPL